MKNLTELEMKSIYGGVPQAYYMDNDVIKTAGKIFKFGLKFLEEIYVRWVETDL